jgi:peptide subunit release factor 1 (eRF1)
MHDNDDIVKDGFCPEDYPLVKFVCPDCGTLEEITPEERAEDPVRRCRKCSTVMDEISNGDVWHTFWRF